MSKQTVKPYNQEGSKKQQVGQMFDNIASSYDFLNRFLSLGIDQSWRKTAIAQLEGRSLKRVLDVATGTGDVAIALHKKLAPEKVVGLDLSANMLAIGKDKIAAKHLTEAIDMIQGDSEDLPFEDQDFEAATVAFGVRNFENLDKGLAEIQRVLKPGGRLVVLEFSSPRVFPFRQVYSFYFKRILPLVGRFFSKDPKAYQYLFESVQAFPEGDAFLERLRTAGFDQVKEKRLTLGVCSVYTADKK